MTTSSAIMPPILRSTILAIALSALVGCASNQQRSLQPDEYFSASGVTVHAPVGELWELAEQRSDDVMVLNFSRPEPDATNTSTVLVVGVERYDEGGLAQQYGSEAGFYRHVRQQWEDKATDDDANDRFEVTDARAWIEEYRGRQVLRAKSTVKERDNPIAPDITFILDTGQFVRTHPNNEDVVISILWSRRAPLGARAASAESIANGVIASLEFD